MLDHRKTKGIPKNIYFCFIDYAKAFDHLDHKKTMENSSRDGNTRPPYLSPEEAVCRTRRNSWNWKWNADWFKIGKGVIRPVYCQLIYLTYMQSTSCEMPGWINHKLESRLPGEISTTSDMHMIPL